MERMFYGSSLLRTTLKGIALTVFAGSVACAGCGEDNTNNGTNNGTVNNTVNNTQNNTVNNTVNNTTVLDPGGATVSPEMLTVSEAGGTGTFTIVLDAEPAEALSIDLTSSDTSEATVAPATLEFDATNWDSPQTVTVTGVDDEELDGPQTITIQTDLTGGGSNYTTVDPADVSVTVTDDDMAAVSVSKSEVVVTEGGAGQTFDVVLNGQPTGAVTIPVSASDDTEFTVDVTELAFDDTNFDTPQTVTVTAVDDSDVEMVEMGTVVLDAATGGGYDGIDPSDVGVTIIDNDNVQQGSLVTSPSGVSTSETGTTATFDVTLSQAPSDTVTVTVTSTDTTEGTVAPASLTFDDTNFDTAQTVTVTGVDDQDVDGPVTYDVSLTTASNDGAFDGLMDAVSVTNIDDDNAQINVSPQSLTVNEGGPTTATFDVSLSTDPGGTVTIDVASSDTDQATAAPAQLTFDSANFSTAQTVTVTAVDDDVADGTVTIDILTTVNAAGTSYDGVAAADPSVTVIDDDQAGIAVDPTAGLTTGEDGTSDTFTIALNTEPTGDVTIALSSDNTDEGTVAPASVTFTTANWNTAQTVTVTGVDDALDDGTVNYNVITAPATSTDSAYDGLNAPNVSVQNTDDDTAGYTVEPLTGLQTSEDLGTDTFTVVLNTPPTDDVTIPVASSDTSEGTVSPATLTFTDQDWSTPQTVTVTGVNDMIADGPISYFINLDQATSNDAAYSGLAPPNVQVTNNDNEAGVTVDPSSGLTTNESGTTDTFEIFLNAQPTANVVVDLSSTDTNEGTVDPTQIIFTPSNFSTPRPVTLTGVDDNDIDDTQPYEIDFVFTSLDDRYDAGAPANFDIPNVTAENTDDDQPAITVTPTSGLSVNEDGATETFDIELSTIPAAGEEVVIDVTSQDDTEILLSGCGTGTPTDAITCTLDSANWDGVTVTLTGQDDTTIDGSVQVTIDLTLDTGATDADEYDAIDPANVTANNVDNDAAEIITRTVRSSSFNSFQRELTHENTGVDFESQGPIYRLDVEVELTFPPSDDVVVQLQSSDTTEGVVTGIYTGASGNTFVAGQRTLVFDSAGSNSYSCDGSGGSLCQRFRIEGVDDPDTDGDIAYTAQITQSTSDPNYNGVEPDDIPLVNIDDDQQGMYSIPFSGTEMRASEADDGVYGSNYYSPREFVLVKRAPTAQAIDITATVTDDTEADVCVYTQAGSTCGILQTGACGTNSTNTMPSGIGIWCGAVYGLEDPIVDGTQDYTVNFSLASTDANYNGAPVDSLPASTTDNDGASIDVFNFGTASISENAGTTTFDVVLTSEPSDDVTVPIASSDTSEATVDKASLTFTTANWATAQTVTVTGEDDNEADGPQDVTIQVGPATSADGDYDGANPGDWDITVTDDDLPGLTIVNVDTTTNEDGDTAEFDLSLSAQPTDDVELTFIESSDEISISTTTMTFTPQDWDSVQTLIVTGEDDAISDGGQGWTVTIDYLVSNDSDYSGLGPYTLTGTNNDNDGVGIAVTPGFGLLTSEDLTSDTFSVVLTSQPTDDVVIDVASSDTSEATVDKSQLTFTAGNWSNAQVVTVTGEDDATQETATVPFMIELTVNGSTADAAYAALDPIDPWGANIDNDNPGMVVNTNPWGIVTGENGDTDTFTLRLATAPQTNRQVVVDLSSTEPTEATVSPAQIIFDGNNWDTPQTITVTGQAVDLFEAANRYFEVEVVVNDTDTDDTLYPALADITLEGVSLDDDICRVTVRPYSTTASRISVPTGAAFPVAYFANVDSTANVDFDASLTDGTGDGEFNVDGNITGAAQTVTLNTAGTPQVLWYQGEAAGGFTASYTSVTSTDMCYDPNTGSVTPTDHSDVETSGSSSTTYFNAN